MISGLDIQISHPLIILKDRHYLQKGQIRIDMGDIKITNELKPESGRWQLQRDKTALTSIMLIKGKGLTMQYLKVDDHHL